MIVYRVARATSLHESRRWSPPGDLDEAMEAFVRRADKFGDRLRYRIRQRNKGDTLGMERNLADTVKRLRARLSRAELGDVFAVKVSTQGNVILGTLLVRVIDVMPDPAQTIGNDRVDQYAGWVIAEFAGIENWGYCARRFVAGSTTWTQHSPWPASDPGANASDWHHDTFSEMQRLFDQSVDLAEEFALQTVIFNRKDWMRGRGITSYGGLNPHTDHLHGDHFPNRTGSPRASCP